VTTIKATKVDKKNKKCYNHIKQECCLSGDRTTSR